MGYRLIIRDLSGTATYHDASANDPKCTGRERPGYRVVEAATLRDIAVLTFRDGLKVVPCATCRPPDLPA